MGVRIGRGGNGSHGYPPHKGLHQEEADDNSGEGSLLSRTCTVNGGGADAGDNTVGAMVR